MENTIIFLVGLLFGSLVGIVVYKTFKDGANE